ncbi:MAG: PrsW family intramembrane metalloprotease [Bacteroidota bacterium]
MEISLLGLAVAPGAAIALYVYFRDKYEKEPLSLLLKTFFAGFFVVIIAAMAETMLMELFPTDNTRVGSTILNTFVFIGLTEELCKYICLYLIAYSKSDFNEPFDGIVYAVMVSMGFATSENIMYVMDGGMQVALIRIFTALPAHATFGVMMGYFVGLAKFKNHDIGLLLIGLGTATFFHGLYDFFLTINSMELLALGAFVSLLVGLRFSFKAMRLLSENSPFRYSTIILGQKQMDRQ